MKRSKEAFARPHGFADFEFVRAGPDGACWVSPGGMVVRVAAAEAASQKQKEAERRDRAQAEREIALGRSGAT